MSRDRADLRRLHFINALFAHATPPAKEDPIAPLLRYGGFPEPFLSANDFLD